ncbi:MAG: hypothetical protein AAGB15_00895 [Pseudomonadota bacterium]
MRLPTLLALLVMAIAGQAEARQVMAKAQCQTTFDGVRYAGVYVKEYWSYHHTFRHYGRFQNAKRQVVEFEIMSGSDQGAGGLWINGARHREVKVYFQAFRGGFRMKADGGQTTVFTCR